MNKENIIATLAKHDITVLNESRVNNCGDKLELSNGAIVNIFDSGKINYQGKNANVVKDIITNHPKAENVNNKVFVVYGHDHVARTQLEAMLRRWSLEPLILDQLVTAGTTVIEKLEEYTQQVNFVVLLTFCIPHHLSLRSPYRLVWPKQFQN